MSYKWLLFDVDNTLIDFTKSSMFAFQMMCQEFDVEYSLGLYEAYKEINHQVWAEMEQGKITAEELKTKRFRIFFETYNINEDPLEANELYFQNLSKKTFPIDGAMDLLDWASGKYQLVAVTNGMAQVQKPRLSNHPIGSYFDHIFIADEIGHHKPSFAFFQHVYNAIGRPDKKEILLIGDTQQSDMIGGKRFGIDTCWYNFTHEKDNIDVPKNYRIDHLSELKSILI